MPPVHVSNTYVEPDDLIVFYDTDRVLDLVSDTALGAPRATVADLSASGSAAYRRALAIIQSAAGDVDSHCQMGKRYTRENLETIVNDYWDAPADQAKAKRARILQQIVADLTFGLLLSRRGYTGDQLRQQAPRYEEALKTLDRLAQGIQVFDLDANVNASVPVRVSIGLTSYRPSLDNAMFGIWPNWPYGRLNGPFPY